MAKLLPGSGRPVGAAFVANFVQPKVKVKTVKNADGSKVPLAPNGRYLLDFDLSSFDTSQLEALYNALESENSRDIEKYNPKLSAFVKKHGQVSSDQIPDSPLIKQLKQIPTSDIRSYNLVKFYEKRAEDFSKDQHIESEAQKLFDDAFLIPVLKAELKAEEIAAASDALSRHKRLQLQNEQDAELIKARLKTFNSPESVRNRNLEKIADKKAAASEAESSASKESDGDFQAQTKSDADYSPSDDALRELFVFLQNPNTFKLSPNARAARAYLANFLGVDSFSDQILSHLSSKFAKFIKKPANERGSSVKLPQNQTDSQDPFSPSYYVSRNKALASERRKALSGDRTVSKDSKKGRVHHSYSFDPVTVGSFIFGLNDATYPARLLFPKNPVALAFGKIDPAEFVYGYDVPSAYALFREIGEDFLNDPRVTDDVLLELEPYIRSHGQERLNYPDEELPRAKELNEEQPDILGSNPDEHLKNLQGRHLSPETQVAYANARDIDGSNVSVSNNKRLSSLFADALTASTPPGGTMRMLYSPNRNGTLTLNPLVKSWLNQVNNRVAAFLKGGGRGAPPRFVFPGVLALMPKEHFFGEAVSGRVSPLDLKQRFLTEIASQFPALFSETNGFGEDFVKFNVVNHPLALLKRSDPSDVLSGVSALASPTAETFADHGNAAFRRAATNIALHGNDSFAKEFENLRTSFIKRLEDAIDIINKQNLGDPYSELDLPSVLDLLLRGYTKDAFRLYAQNHNAFMQKGFEASKQARDAAARHSIISFLSDFQKKLPLYISALHPSSGGSFSLDPYHPLLPSELINNPFAVYNSVFGESPLSQLARFNHPSSPSLSVSPDLRNSIARLLDLHALLTKDPSNLGLISQMTAAANELPSPYRIRTGDITRPVQKPALISPDDFTSSFNSMLDLFSLIKRSIP